MSEQKSKGDHKFWIPRDGGLALKKEELDHSKWVAHVNQGWDLALKALQETGWHCERGLDDIDPAKDFDEFYLTAALFTQPKWVLVSKNLIFERAVFVDRVKNLARRLESLNGDGAISYSTDTDLIRSWPEEVIVEAYTIGRMLSHNPTLRHLAGYSVKEGPRDATAERRKTVLALWPRRYQQVRAARKRYTANKKDDWKTIIKNADSQLPDWLIDELPRDSKQEPKQLAARWLAEELRSTPSAILEDVKVLKKSGEL